MSKRYSPRGWIRRESASTATGRWHAVEEPGREATDRVPDDKLAALIGDDSETLARWKDRLGRYVDTQGALDALRLRRPSEPPWPAADNPMLGYLLERASEIARDEDIDAALAWLASNAWFEGAVGERARFSRHLNTD